VGASAQVVGKERAETKRKGRKGRKEKSIKRGTCQKKKGRLKKMLSADANMADRQGWGARSIAARSSRKIRKK